jgi:hypothetical protein
MARSVSREARPLCQQLREMRTCEAILYGGQKGVNDPTRTKHGLFGLSPQLARADEFEAAPRYPCCCFSAVLFAGPIRTNIITMAATSSTMQVMIGTV